MPKKNKKKKRHKSTGCNKRKFDTTDEAEQALKHINEVSKYLPKRMERRYYWCHRCEGYHLTKQRRIQG